MSENLIRTLERVLSLYEELLECSRAKTDHLVASDVEAIEASQGREEMIIGKLASIEGARHKAVAESAEMLGVTTVPPTISAIVMAMGDEAQGEARARLQELRDALAAVSKELAAVNRLNEELCTQSLVHLNVYMNLITGRSSKSQVYDARGRTQAYAGRALVSRSA
ncbi:MAG: flagellar protein FlgN [Planctomycetes bacterium]|nr:flagellar protein FlgN [Planctomycetota bacterium]